MPLEHEDIAITFSLRESLPCRESCGQSWLYRGRAGEGTPSIGLVDCALTMLEGGTLSKRRQHRDSHTGFPTNHGHDQNSWAKTKGLTRFSSGFAFPAAQQQDLSGLDLQSCCGLNFKEDKEGCVVKENSRQSKRSYLMCPICWMTPWALPAESKSCLSQLSHKKLIGVNEELKKLQRTIKITGSCWWVGNYFSQNTKIGWREVVIIFQIATVENGQHWARERGRMQSKPGFDFRFRSLQTRQMLHLRLFQDRGSL